MKNFHLIPVAGEEELEEVFNRPENESPLSRFRRIARLAILKSTERKWNDVVMGICQAYVYNSLPKFLKNIKEKRKNTKEKILKKKKYKKKEKY